MIYNKRRVILRITWQLCLQFQVWETIQKVRQSVGKKVASSTKVGLVRENHSFVPIMCAGNPMQNKHRKVTKLDQNKKEGAKLKFVSLLIDFLLGGRERTEKR